MRVVNHVIPEAAVEAAIELQAETQEHIRRQVIPEAAVEALARILAESALFDADCGGYGWDAEKDSSDHFMPTARKKARRYLEAAAPHMLAQD